MPVFIRKTLIIFFGIFLIAVSMGYGKDIHLNNIEVYSIEHGLSQTRVTSIVQDEKGYLWVGTQDGLNLFDGYTFQVFHHNPLDTNSISNNYIRDLHEDENGNLWIATSYGLNRYDLEKGVFQRFHHDDNDPNSLSSNLIYDLFQDNEGNLWIKTLETLDKYIPAKESFKHYYHYNQISNFIAGDSYLSIHEDSKGNLWIGTLDGLSLFDKETELFKHFSHDEKNSRSISNNRIKTIYEDHTNILWIGTENGLNKYDPGNNTFKRYYADDDDPTTLTNSTVNVIYEDGNNNLWIGTNFGLNLYRPEEDNFERVIKIFHNNIEQPITFVSSIMEDLSHVLWIGSFQGLIKYDTKRGKFQFYSNSPRSNKPQLSGDIIGGIYKDLSGSLYIGTWGNGLNILKRKSGDISYYNTLNSNLTSDFVHVMYEHFDNTIWMGTRDGISIYNPESDRFTDFGDKVKGIDRTILKNNRIYDFTLSSDSTIWISSANGLFSFDPFTAAFDVYQQLDFEDHKVYLKQVYCTEEDNNKQLWIGTDNGLICFDPARGSFKHYFRKTNDGSFTISSNNIFSIHVNSSNDIWVGTPSGLNKYNPENDNFKIYTTKNGLPNNLIYAIVEDNRGNLWMSTNRGLSSFDPVREKFTNYDISDGLQHYEYNIGAAHRSNDGELFFGGIKGLNSFYPDSISQNSFIPNVVITSFEIVTQNGQEDLNIKGKQNIQIPPNTSMFTLQFAALDFTYPKDNKYAYKLTKEGHESNWINLGTLRQASFSNLPAGSYVFTVIGSNNDEVWNEIGTSLNIHIKAKIWKSKGAVFLYAFIIAVLVYLIIAIRTRNVKKLKQHLRERDLYAKEIDIQKELLTLKNKNITDSINYAKRIQESLRPSTKIFKKILPESFVFHKPKDIVSGDFYWVNESEDKVFLAAVDCTGHGVPGAFMSIIGFELFRRITNQGQIDPGKILTHLNRDFEEIFSDVEDMTMRDGMDIALCVFDKKSKELSFAGAFNPMYLIRDNKLIEFKGNRFSIGLDETDSKEQIFDTHSIAIHPDDVVYIFTDGFADQFGGTAGKKFKYRRFRHLLLSIHKKPLDQQANQLNQSLKNWKGNYDQVDDILVIGTNFNNYL